MRCTTEADSLGDQTSVLNCLDISTTNKILPKYDANNPVCQTALYFNFTPHGNKEDKQIVDQSKFTKEKRSRWHV